MNGEAAMNMEMDDLRKRLDSQKYIYDDELIITLFVALKLGRPLLIEGAAGVGKTEVAKAMAGALERRLVRLQCYEGLDETKALYEWNYQKQLLSIQVHMSKGQEDPEGLRDPCSETSIWLDARFCNRSEAASP
jgi:MoxR-like ATPase